PRSRRRCAAPGISEASSVLRTSPPWDRSASGPALFPAGPGPNPPYGGTYPNLTPQQPGGTFRDLEPQGPSSQPNQAYSQPIPGADAQTQKINTGALYPGNGPLASAMDPNSGGLPTVMGPRAFGDTTLGHGVDLGKPGTPLPPPGDDEPTIRSLPGEASGGAGQ
ncbi:hypothetical protein ACWELQ_43085, partial [Nocardia sp. NPDC004722]